MLQVLSCWLRFGYLQLFCKLVPNFTITTTVLKEVTFRPSPIKKAVEALVSEEKIQILPDLVLPDASLQLYRSLGLHDGEISILASTKKAEDVVIFDDLIARSVARAEGFHLTGLLGLLVSLKSKKKLSKSATFTILSAINKTNFRMTAMLYETIQLELSSEEE